MLQHQTDVGAVQPVLIVAISAVDMVCPRQGFSQVAAHQILVAQLSAYGGSSQHPIEVSVQVHAIHIRAMVVERIDVWGVAKQLKTVHRPVPVDGGFQVQSSLLVLCRHSGVGLEGVLKLVVPFRPIEGVGAKVSHTQAGVPVYIHLLIVIMALIESLSTFVVGIQTACLVPAVAVAPYVAARDAVPGLAVQGHSAAYLGIAIRAALGMQADTLSVCLVVAL